MTPEETRELSRRVAEAVGTDEAWDWARRCPKGHTVAAAVGKKPLPDRDGAAWCNGCSQDDIAVSYPQNVWAYVRLNPRPYAESLDLTIPVVEEKCAAINVTWSIRRQSIGHVDAVVGGYIGEGDTAAEAVARALVAAVEGWS